MSGMRKLRSSASARSAGSLMALVFLVLMAVIFIVPYIWVFVSAFKVDKEVMQSGGFMFFPKTWTLANFAEVLDPTNKQLPIYRWFANSTFISGVHTALSVAVYAMSAYAYSKMKFKGRDAIFITLFFFSSFPAIVNIIPLYKEMQILGWLNKPAALIVPGITSVFNIFLIRQFMYAIPDSLIESAKIDGAGDLTIFLRIIVPLSRPILIAVALFSFKVNWNDFLWPSIAINNVDKLTLTAGLQLAQGIYLQKVPQTSALATVAIVPMMILFLCTQKYFLSGISLSSGVKG